MKKANHLLNEKSPYLQQHVYNPVDWYPWGKAAFDLAKREEKPIFLSIGYSSCHWCHVMEKESFEDEEVARVLNRSFVSVKVDREERPDIDVVYMKVCQMLTGQGGWPLTIIMTPDQLPFFAGTYLPKEAKYGLQGLMELLKRIEEQWNQDKEKLVGTGERISQFARKESEKEREASDVEFSLLSRAYQELYSVFDEKYGGFHHAPKFPIPHQLLFLMEYAKKTGDPVSLHMAKKTLLSMYLGGIFDHVGGGFSRYSTDEKWLVPHFEKMLYDNALLIIAYAKVYEMTGDEIYQYVAVRTIRYVLSELRDRDGGFYCGQDADSDGEEGKYYLFTPTEICLVLGKEAGDAFNTFYHVTEDGNFKYANILNLIENADYRKEKELEAKQEKLLKYRKERLEIGTDDKVLVSWNGLMMAALSISAGIFGEESYYSYALQSLLFIEDNMAMENGMLMSRYKDGQVAHVATLADYAYFSFGLLSMYEYSHDVDLLVTISKYITVMLEEFFDYERGGFYLYGKSAEALLLRPKEDYDGALPSGNSVAGYVLNRMAEISGKESMKLCAKKQLSYLAAVSKENPSGHTFGLLALIGEIYPKSQLVIVVSKQAKREEYLPKQAAKRLQKAGVLVFVKTKENEARLASVSPFTMQYEIKKDGILYYYCENHHCLAPVSELSEILRIVDQEEG